MKNNMKKIGLIAGFIAMVIACTKKDDTVDPVLEPPVDKVTYASADEVAAKELVAYFSFNGDGKESKSSAMPATSVKASYSAGKKGQALTLDDGYLLYNELVNLNSMKAFTVSAWVNFKNTNKPGSVFSLLRPAVNNVHPWNGSLNLFIEGMPVNSDTMRVKGLFSLVKDGGVRLQDSINDPSKGGSQAFKGGNKWVQIIMKYNPTNSMFQVYGNGVKISNPEWEYRQYNNSGFGEGTIESPSKVMIGGWGSLLPGGNVEAWQVPFKGQIDEVRVYNKALTDDEITALFKNEDAGK